jgi:hypothetical protein
MNLMKMIIVMFLHCVSDLALLCRLNTNDLLEKVPGDLLQGCILLWETDTGFAEITQEERGK